MSFYINDGESPQVLARVLIEMGRQASNAEAQASHAESRLREEERENEALRKEISNTRSLYNEVLQKFKGREEAINQCAEQLGIEKRENSKLREVHQELQAQISTLALSNKELLTQIKKLKSRLERRKG